MQIIETLGIILLLVTSHPELPSGKPTGLWLEEFAVPYEILSNAGYEVVVVSPKGDAAPVDPRSLPETPTPSEREALRILQHTTALSDLKPGPYAGVFVAGGHGTMFDFPKHPAVRALVLHCLKEDLPIALVCHGPAALVGAAAGRPSLLEDRRVTGFTNAEEKAVDLVDEVPFLLEDQLKALGADFQGGPDFEAHIVTDGNLITGQNPASSEPAAHKLLERIQTRD